MADTKQALLDLGMPMLLKHGYHDLGVATLLQVAGVPKGSFYHHFKSKEDFVLQVVDLYMDAVHAGLEDTLGNESLPPLARVRGFFEATSVKYRDEGYMGCLLGGLGQELSGTNDVFRQRIERCLSAIARRIATCLDEGVRRGDLPRDTDARRMAELLVNCWEGAALRTRLQRDPRPLMEMLDFYFRAAAA